MREHILKLKEEIQRQLGQLIDNDYVLLNLPYHYNIGDVIIWEGERSFLKTLPYQCLDFSSFAPVHEIKEGTVILLHGGGNFGDLYRVHQEFRLDIISRYPSNKIIMFPQSVCYQNEAYIVHDAQLMAKHRNLYLCARDLPSYNFLKKHFNSNNILLVPDMAFCVQDKYLSKYLNKAKKKNLFLYRTDKEINMNKDFIFPDGYEQRDWPTCNKTEIVPLLLAYFDDKIRNLNKKSPTWHSLIKWYANSVFRPYMVRKGFSFIGNYNEIVTTRLHGLIVSVLLEKKVSYVDNISGKLSSYVNTWLSEVETVQEY